MVQDLELLNQNYELFIEHCSKCANSEAIKGFVDNQFRKYISHNPNMVLDFMAQIERCFPEVQNDLEDEYPMAEREIFSFRLEMTSKKNPQVQWLYSYICMLSADDNLLDTVLMRYSAKMSMPNTKVDSNVSFCCDHPKEKLERLYHELLRNDIIEGREDMFVKIFTGKNRNEIKKIIWKIRTNRGVRNESLFILLYYLSPLEIRSKTSATIICKKLVSCFDGLSEGSLLSGYSDWLKVGVEKLAVLKKDTTPSNKLYYLLDYLHNNFPVF